MPVPQRRDNPSSDVKHEAKIRTFAGPGPSSGGLVTAIRTAEPASAPLMER
jgi:hypothetical protein